MYITIEVRDVYGVQTVYPVCKKAKLFAELAGTKTLTHLALCRIEALGYEVLQRSAPLKFHVGA